MNIFKLILLFLGISIQSFAVECVQKYESIIVQLNKNCPEGYVEKMNKVFSPSETGVSWLDVSEEKICERIVYDDTIDCEMPNLISSLEKDLLTNKFITYKTTEEGENKVLYKSCSEIKKTYPSTKSGYFKLWQGYEVYCDMETDGGGWTLVMSDEGDSFKYEDLAWTTDNFVGNNPREEKHKSKAFNEIPVKEILVRINNKDMIINKEVPSMLDIFKNNIEQNTEYGRTTWKQIILDSSLQNYCNKEGFNIDYANKARIGISSNQVNDCKSNDSILGVGIKHNYSGCNFSSGNCAYSSGNDNGNKYLKLKSKLFVRDLSDTEKVQIENQNSVEKIIVQRQINENLKSCAELKLEYNNLKSGIYTINPLGKEKIKVYCDMETDGGGWTLVMNLDTSDGHYMDWTRGWISPYNIGTPSNPFNSDYQNKDLWNNLKTNGIMIKNHEQGFVNATKVYKFKPEYKEKTLSYLFNNVQRQEVTNPSYIYKKSTNVSTDYLSKDVIMSKPGALAFNWTYSNNAVRITNTGTRLSPSGVNDDLTRGLGTHFCLTPYDNIKGIETSGCNWQLEVSGLWFEGTSSSSNACIGSDCEVKNSSTLSNRDYDYAIFIREMDNGLFEEIKKNQEIKNVEISKSCLELKEKDNTLSSGIYLVNPTGIKEEKVYCDMETDGGGWTLAIRLNTNDSELQDFDSDFWKTRDEKGKIEDKNDYISKVGIHIPMKEIKLSYIMDEKEKIEKIYNNIQNSDTLFQNYNLKLDNNNPIWKEVYKYGTNVDLFYGDKLVFQTKGDYGVYPDYSRIWFNHKNIGDCNQGGSIGHIGDYGVNNWKWEVARGLDSSTNCQHNTYKLGLGSNYDSKSWGRTSINPSNFYTNGVMYIYVRERYPKLDNQNFPKSCTDLLNKNINKSGFYVIKPNEQIKPFKVYCDMETDGGGWTKISYIKNLPYQKQFSKDGRKWFPNNFNDQGYLELTNEQINALREISTEGKQKYIQRCNGVISYEYKRNNSYNSKLHFRMIDNSQTAKEEDLNINSKGYNGWNIEVLQDGCSSNGGENGSLLKTTIFEIKSTSVPIINVSTADNGDANEFFGSNFIDNPAWLRGNIIKEVELNSEKIYRNCTNALNEGEKNNGFYKIKPTSTIEPFNVYCDMENGGWTKISYSNDIPLTEHFTDGVDSREWFIKDLDEMGYFSLTKEQINAIRESSTKGKQRFVTTCNNFMAYKQNATSSYKYKLQFKLFNNKTTEFENLSEDKPEYNIEKYTIIQDGCSMNSNQNGTLENATIFDFESIDLPIKNISSLDNGNEGDVFGSPLTNNPAWFKGDRESERINFSCSTIKKSNPKSKSGYYTISPNGLETNVYCDMETDGGGWTYLVNNKEPIENTNDKNTNYEAITNALFGNGLNKIIKYEIPGVMKSYYKRIKEYTNQNFFDSFVRTWRNTNNKLGEDFGIYSTYEDVLNGKKMWKYCNYSNESSPEHVGVGFPRDCGPNGPVGGMWLQGDTQNSNSYGKWTAQNRSYILAIKDESPTIETSIEDLIVKPTSCLDIQAIDKEAKSGIYEVYLGSNKTTVYCNMDYQGGGWTLVWSNLQNINQVNMRYRSWTSTTTTISDFVGDYNNKNNDYYKGTPNTFEVFIGLNYWRTLINNKDGEFAYIWKRNNTNEIIDQSFVADIKPFNSTYYLQLSNYKQINGTTTSGVWSYHNNRRWMTYDRYNNNCATYYDYTPFWYGSCWSGNMNGGGPNKGSGYYNGAYWTSSSKYWGRSNGSGAGAGWYFLRPKEVSDGVKKYLEKNQEVITREEDLPKYNSCLEILKKEPTSTSGYYSVKDGMTTKKVYCDMETDGGGWTKFHEHKITDGKYGSTFTNYPAKEFMTKYKGMIWYNHYGYKRTTHQMFDVFLPNEEKECFSSWHNDFDISYEKILKNQKISNPVYSYYKNSCKWNTDNYEKPYGYYTNKFKNYVPINTPIYFGDYKNISGDYSWDSKGYTGEEIFELFFREDTKTNLSKYKSCKDIKEEGITKTGKYLINPSGEEDILVYCNFEYDDVAYIESENLVKNPNFENGEGIPGEKDSTGKNEIIKMESPVSSGYVLLPEAGKEYTINETSLKKNLKPNTKYKLGVWTYVDSNYNGTKDSLYTDFYDITNKKYSTKKYQKIEQTKEINGKTWEYITLMFTTPSSLNGTWIGHIGLELKKYKGKKYLVGYSLTELMEEHPKTIKDYKYTTCKELKKDIPNSISGVYRLNGIKVYCEMDYLGGGWTAIFSNAGGDTNISKPTLSNEQLWDSTKQDSVELEKYTSQKNSTMWNYFNNKKRVEVLKIQKRSDHNYDWKTIYLDLGEETTWNQITKYSNSTNKVFYELPSKVSMYIDNNYYGKTNLLMSYTGSIGFANRDNSDYTSTTSEDNKMFGFNARHVISYIHNVINKDTVKCQLNCQSNSSLYGQEITFLMREKEEIEPLKQGVFNEELALYLPMDENQGGVIDYTNNQMGQTIGTTIGDGRFGNARYFTNVIDSIKFDNFNIQGDKTMSFWIKSNSASSTSEDLQLGFVDDSYNPGTMFGMIYGGEPSEDLSFLGHSKEYNFSINSYKNKWSSNGQWHNVILLKENNILKIYLNGVLQTLVNNLNGDSSKEVKILNTLNNYFKINYKNYLNNGYKAVDEVAIWNKVLTEEQIKLIATSNKPLINLIGETNKNIEIKSCLDLKKNNFISKTGYYIINGEKTYCDMETDGGGWTHVATLSDEDYDVWSQLMYPNNTGVWENDNSFGEHSFSKDWKSKSYSIINGSEMLIKEGKSSQNNVLKTIGNCLEGKTLNKLFSELTWNANASDSNWSDNSGAKICNYTHFGYYDPVLRANANGKKEIAFKWGEKELVQDNNKDRTMIRTMNAYNDNGDVQVDSPVGLGSFVSYSGQEYYEDAGECRGDGPEKCGDNKHHYQIYIRENINTMEDTKKEKVESDVNYNYRELKNCREIKSENMELTSGLYEITYNTEYRTVYCDMETDGGGWTLIARSVSGNKIDWGCDTNISNDMFGWFVNQGNIRNISSPYSISVKNIETREIIFGDYINTYDWGDNVYIKELGKNFLEDNYNKSSFVENQKLVKGDVSTSTMDNFIGYTNKTNHYSFKDLDSFGHGLYSKGWATCYGSKNSPDSKGMKLNTKQGMIMVRDFRPIEKKIIEDQKEQIFNQKNQSCKDILKIQPSAPSAYYRINAKNGRDYEVYCDMDYFDGKGWIDIIKTLKKNPENYNLFFEKDSIKKVEILKNKNGKEGLLIEYSYQSNHMTPLYLNINKTFNNNKIRMNWKMQGSESGDKCTNSNSWVPMNGPGFEGGTNSYQVPCKSGYSCIQGTTENYRDKPIEAKYFNKNLKNNQILAWSGSNITNSSISKDCTRDLNIPSGKSALWFEDLYISNEEGPINFEYGEYKSCNEVLKDNIYASSGLYKLKSKSGIVYEMYCDMETEGGGWIDVVKTIDNNIDTYKLFFENNSLKNVYTAKNNINELGIVLEYVGSYNHADPIHLNINKEYSNNEVNISWRLQGTEDGYRCRSGNWVPLNGPGYNGNYSGYQAPCKSGYSCIQGKTTNGRDLPIAANYTSNNIKENNLLTWSGSNTWSSSISQNCSRDTKIPTNKAALWINKLKVKSTMDLNIDGNYEDTEIFEYGTKNPMLDICNEGYTLDLEKKECFKNEKYRDYLPVSGKNYYAYQAENYCRSISDNKMELFYPINSTELQSLVSKYGHTYFWIMGIYPKSNGSNCKSKSFNSKKCTSWGPKSGGEWFVSNNSKSEPSGDNHVNASMRYWWNGNSLGNLYQWNDTPYPGYQNNYGRFMCSSIKGQEPTRKITYSINDKQLCGDNYFYNSENKKCEMIISVKSTCSDILNEGFSKGNGYYYLKTSDNKVFKAYCDMETDGGGWMLVDNTFPYQKGRECSSGWGIIDSNNIWKLNIDSSSDNAYGSSSHGGCGITITRKIPFEKIKLTNMNVTSNKSCGSVLFPSPRVYGVEDNNIPNSNWTNYYYPGHNYQSMGSYTSITSANISSTASTQIITMNQGFKENYIHIGIKAYNGCHNRTVYTKVWVK